MPRYPYYCETCEDAWEIQSPMSEMRGHVEWCPKCDIEALRIWDRDGMIRVTGGASPTRIGDSYQRVSRGNDRGFTKEFEAIWEGATPASPVTGEKYEIFDDEGGDGRYTGLPSEKEEYKKGAAMAKASGNMPSPERQAHDRAVSIDRMVERARNNLREKSPQRKASRS